MSAWLRKRFAILVKSKKTILLTVSAGHTDLLYTRSSDPILASGALKGIIEIGFEDCLDTLLEQFSHGVIEAGENSRMLFLEAYYIHAVKTSQKPPITYLEKVSLPLF
ncbi:hypothetical protein C1645_761771 [Glomus cerebriforme]|uniref:Uncharacterized protein n=1 Tax=Glomus cerebriforme TaxID=658196 RepID=A0A397T5Z5_9GLOM|nr:hypothetical protein C1645_761771 [Glomus cerebriforme]